MKKLFLMLSLFFSSHLFAQESLPENCTSKGFGFQNKQIIFNNQGDVQSRVFVIHNASKSIVMLSHEEANPGASAGWSTKLDKDKWAVLTTAKPNFSLACLLYSPPSIGPQECGNVVTVCAIPTKVSLGGFWIAENATLTKVLETLKIRGLLNGGQ